MRSVASFVAESHNREVIAGLLRAGVVPVPLAPAAASASEAGNDRQSSAVGAPGRLAGRTIVVTGTLAGMSRPEAEDLIRLHGGTASGSVSRKTDYVLAGENAGSKLVRATELGVPVIDLDHFLRMIRSDDDAKSG
jgi:DNA ligase (NAD+)